MKYPTAERPGIRGLLSKQGIFGLVLLLVPGAMLVALAIRKIAGDPLTGISALNEGRGIGACGVFIFFGYWQVWSAVTGEDYKGQREKVAREQAREMKEKLWREGKKRRMHEGEHLHEQKPRGSRDSHPE